MAIIWQKRIAEDLYEIRNAGSSIRLYSNGVFHSQYNAKQKISNSIWDLLILPALFYPQGMINRVLILGVGGGAAIKLLQNYSSPRHIVGIELNQTHLKIARRFFKINKKEADLICDDAVAWLNAYTGPAFDMIIDDLFGHQDGETVRAVSLNSRWFTLLNRHLTRQGILVVNTAELSDLKNSGFLTNHRVRAMFKSTYKFTHPTCENRVYAFCKTDVSLQALNNNIAAIADSLPRRSFSSLASRARKFKPHNN